MTTPWRLDARWPVPASVRAFTTQRHGLGVSAAPFDEFNLGLRTGDEAETVLRNRALLVEHAGLPSPPHWLRQVHGTAVVRCDAMAAPPANAGGGWERAEPEADASVTSTPGQVLAILTADCLPALFCADDGSEVGAAHAGWRGLVAGVLESTMAAMRTDPRRVHVWLGPAAGPRHYEIGEEVYEAFVSRDADAAGAFAATRPGHWRVDLYALARRRLQAAGVAAGRIHGGDQCTIAEPLRFYSHRRDQRTGRMASLIWIEPPR